MDSSGDDGGDSEKSDDDGGGLARSSAIDAGLTEFAKKMPLFEPERVEGSQRGSQERPLAVNMDLALYRAKFLGRSYRYEEAENILDKVCDKLTLVRNIFLVWVLLFQNCDLKVVILKYVI